MSSNVKYYEEKRHESDRRKMLRDEDARRKLRHCVCYSGVRPLHEIETWLASNATGEFAIAIVRIGDDLNEKTLDVMFEEAADEKAFKAFAGQG